MKRVQVLSRNLGAARNHNADGSLKSQVSAPLSLSVTKGQEEPEFLYEKVMPQGLAIITFNRPHRMNAFTVTSQALYIKLLNRANDDSDVRVVVITGKGRSFSVGMDMAALQEGANTDTSGSEEKERFIPPEDVPQIAATKLNKPVVVAINGPCAGIGFVAAMMGDVRFAVKGAKFTTAFAKRGLVAEHGVGWVLPRIIGTSRALDLLLSSRVFVAEEAYELGVVNKVFDSQEELMRETIKYASAMATECSPAAMAEIKKQVYAHQDINEAFNDTLDLMPKSFRHPDFKEGVNSFIQKRDAEFKGLKAGLIREN